jgi:hypothetical protein
LGRFRPSTSTAATIDNTGVADKSVLVNTNTNDSSHKKFFVNTTRYFT